MTRWLGNWRLRSSMIAIAVLASCLGVIRYEWTKPYPTTIYADSPPRIIWSDGGKHLLGRRSHPVDYEIKCWMTLVKWSDGSTSYHFHHSSSDYPRGRVSR